MGGPGKRLLPWHNPGRIPHRERSPKDKAYCLPRFRHAYQASAACRIHSRCGIALRKKLALTKTWKRATPREVGRKTCHRTLEPEKNWYFLSKQEARQPVLSRHVLQSMKRRIPCPLAPLPRCSNLQSSEEALVRSLTGANKCGRDSGPTNPVSTEPGPRSILRVDISKTLSD